MMKIKNEFLIKLIVIIFICMFCIFVSGVGIMIATQVANFFITGVFLFSSDMFFKIFRFSFVGGGISGISIFIASFFSGK